LMHMHPQNLFQRFRFAEKQLLEVQRTFAIETQ
jgi:hypothetical protein